MTTETVLTDFQIFDCFDRQCAEMVINFDADEIHPIGRAIEQAVLQSPEVQAWKLDAERYRWLRQAGVDHSTDIDVVDAEGCCLNEEELDDAIDTAMESKT